jgi:hypothetical protein
VLHWIWIIALGVIGGCVLLAFSGPTAPDSLPQRVVRLLLSPGMLAERMYRHLFPNQPASHHDVAFLAGQVSFYTICICLLCYCAVRRKAGQRE